MEWPGCRRIGAHRKNHQRRPRRNFVKTLPVPLTTENSPAKLTALDNAKPQRGIQALENSGELLVALASAGVPLSLRDLAQAAGMPTAKAFTHLVSLVKTGILSRDQAGCFSAGVLSLELGLLALQRLSPTREAEQEILNLANATKLSVATAVLGPLGPTVVQLEESARPQHVSLRIGTVLSLVNTAIGRVFAAHLSPEVLANLLEQDAIRMAGEPWIAAVNRERSAFLESYHEQLRLIATRGIDTALDKPVPGIHTLSAPVFDHTGAICLVIALMGSSGSFDSSLDGEMAHYLRRVAGSLSHRLGYFAAVPTHGG
jgi:DNA-binding IclR family transcriptional regulator